MWSDSVLNIRDDHTIDGDLRQLQGRLREEQRLLIFVIRQLHQMKCAIHGLVLPYEVPKNQQ